MKTVVGVALLYDGRVLAARRSSPPELAGGWEFPGGKVEPGEAPSDAAVREIGEELGCVVVVDDWLPDTVAISEGLELRVCTARLAGGEPIPTEHDMVRWVSGAEIDELAWLPADRPFVVAVRDLLGAAQ